MSTGSRDALVVGHPGHELRLYGWLQSAKPRTFVITDGSGATGVGRLASTEAVITDAGAARGTVFGALTDRAAYEAILRGDADLFRRMASSISDELIANEITSVAGDGWEGYNPVHDICRLVVDAAVTLAARRTGRDVANWSFPLVGRPDAIAAGLEVRVSVLDDDTFAAKLARAARYGELAADVAWAFDTYGRDAFRTEALTRVTLPAWDDTRFLVEVPYYETHAGRRVREGKYGEVIRYREHVMPLGAALCDLVRSETTCASC